MDYTIVYGNSIEELENEVQNLIKKGYVPQGGISSFEEESSNLTRSSNIYTFKNRDHLYKDFCYLCQAMVKVDEEVNYI